LDLEALVEVFAGLEAQQERFGVLRHLSLRLVKFLTKRVSSNDSSRGGLCRLLVPFALLDYLPVVAAPDNNWELA